MPKWLREAPLLWSSLTWIYYAFCELSTCRQSALTCGPIPWTAVMQFADREGMDESDRRDLLYLIRKMDEAYIDHAKEASSKQSAPATKGSPIGGG